jgi:hypothetical protein
MGENQQDDSLPPGLQAALQRESLLAEGRYDAFYFCSRCLGDVAIIDSEIQNAEEQIAHPPESLKGALAPGSSRRVYLDSYLQGLRDARQIISTFTQQGRE